MRDKGNKQGFEVHEITEGFRNHARKVVVMKGPGRDSFRGRKS